MKFKSSIVEMQKSVKLLSSIVNHNHPILAFRYLKLFVNNGRVELKAFDNTLVGSAFPNYAELEDDKIYGNILAKQFMALINSMKVGLDITITIDKNSCRIKSGRSNYKIPVLDSDVFKPAIGELDMDYYNVEFPKEPVWVKGFLIKAKSVSHCLAKESYHRDLQHIYIKDNKMIACDAVRGAVIDFENKLLDGYLIHNRIINCVENVTDSGNIFFTIQDDNFFGKTDNFIFASSLLDVEYPYDNIAPYIEGFEEKAKYNLLLQTEETTEKLARVLMFADSETNAVLMQFEDGVIKFIVENNSYAEESVNIVLDDEENKKQSFAIFVDGKSLRELLAQTTGEARWYSNGETSTQYIHDGELLQFFLGLKK